MAEWSTSWQLLIIEEGTVNKMKIIWNIYYGTRGAAGAYIDSLQKSFRKTGYCSYAFVSCMYKYRTSNVIKIFFPITDRLQGRNIIIKCVRLFELIVAYVIILFGSLFKRPIINIHLIDDFYITYLYIKLFKYLRLPVYVTCHDVMPQVGTMNNRRLIIFRDADRLIVHSNYAKEKLLELLPEKGTIHKIIKYPFPLSSYDEILSDEKLEKAKLQLRQYITGLDNKNYFLFIGVVRRSKGIEMLLEAWSRFELSDECSLIIAGKWAGVDIDDIKANASLLSNCVIIDRYLNDEEFVVLIKNAKFIILPYLDYAHSSILMSCLRLGGNIILSDIDLFKEMLPSYPLTFKKGDIGQLLLILNKAATLSSNDLVKLRYFNQKLLENYDKELDKGIQLSFHVLNEDRN